MKKKKLSKILTLIIIAIFIFQLLPSDVTVVNDFSSNTQNTKAIVSIQLIQNDALFIGRFNLNTLFHKVPARNISINYHQIIVNAIPLNVNLFQIEPFDCRQIIRQSIPRYFNGSKYKSGIFVT